MAEDWRKATDAEILRFVNGKYEPFATSTEIADEYNMSQQSAYDRLMDLSDEGYLDTRKVGGRARVFWLTDDGKRKISN